jgi:SAM-dependent methyltransferase
MVAGSEDIIKRQDRSCTTENAPMSSSMMTYEQGQRDGVDAVNRRSWSQPASLSWLSSLQGFTDAGERAAYWRVADACRGQPILDIGVGSGRTVPLLRALSQEYVAIDYMPEMVEAVRGKFPFVDVRLGDARELSAFADNSFALVVFSFMGIDAVDHAGRQAVLQEVHRVLRPGGIFWFSTLHKGGPAFRERPWRPRWPDQRGGGRLHHAVDVWHSLKGVPRNYINYARNQRRRCDGDGWAVAPFGAHNFGLVVHYISPSQQLEELRQHGFSADTVLIDNDTGESIAGVSEGGRHMDDVYAFNVLTRK